LSSTIDLAFTSQLPRQRLVECTINKELDHSSDHFPVLLQFELSIPRTQPQPTRAWKIADFDLVALTTAACLLLPGEMTTPEQVDTYSKYLIDFTQGLVDLAVSWARPSVFSNRGSCGGSESR
jgi:hypothetical protein